MTKTRKPPKVVFKTHPMLEETAEMERAQKAVQTFIALTEDHHGHGRGRTVRGLPLVHLQR